MLEFLKIADITPVFWAFIVLSMLLKLSDRFPKDLAIWGFVALVRKFTEIDAISNNRVNFLEDISLGSAVRTINNIVRGLILIDVNFISVKFTR